MGFVLGDVKAYALQSQLNTIMPSKSYEDWCQMETWLFHNAIAQWQSGYGWAALIVGTDLAISVDGRDW